MGENVFSESWFVGNPDGEFDVKTGMTDVEIIHVSKISVIAALTAATGVYIHSLNSSAQEAREKVAALSETNQRQQQLVSELTDSLTGVTGRMNKAEEEIRRVDTYNESRKRAYLDACRRIDAVYTDFVGV